MSEAYELSDALSRRDFLRLSGSGLMALGIPLRWTNKALQTDRGQMGRVVDPTLDIYTRPSWASAKVKTLWRDDVFEVEAAWVGDPIPEHNRIWYEIPGLGYGHSATIQPVRDEPNEALHDLSGPRQLAEVTVPFVDARWSPRDDSELAYRFYYGSTYWITGVSQDVKLQKWYRILDDKYTYVYYAPAAAFRPIPMSELVPISPDVPPEDKFIKVDLANQWVSLFEGDTMVFSTKVSTGRKFGREYYLTPVGDFETFRKRPSRHMASGNRATGYDVPGVPWVSYIDEIGDSFHGTYWHNDFGVPRSHGCINMTMDAAKWLYRWTHPVVLENELQVWKAHGTHVNVSF
ncbi:MAG: L,D-transpeptidase [Chloroflexi bacterium]|nr:L,D-transpeptidase [Chloroflexota bacterium]MCI0805595.1 L,D-transpeptidase [Chloroflexota bacterium]